MCLSITPRFEMNCPVDPASANGEDRIAGLVCSFVDTKTLAAECKHLRHERHIFQTALFVKRRQDLLTTADLHPISGLQIQESRWIRIVFRHGMASLRLSIANDAQTSLLLVASSHCCLAC